MAKRQEKKQDVRIVILQRGWVVVGDYSERGSKVFVERAKVIRRWGTTRGLGEIAAGGPTPNTTLDPAGHVEAHELAVVATMTCEAERWNAALSQ
jgi:hypothetical protein